MEPGVVMPNDPTAPESPFKFKSSASKWRKGDMDMLNVHYNYLESHQFDFESIELPHALVGRTAFHFLHGTHLL
jgi:hypothetical protein